MSVVTSILQQTTPYRNGIIVGSQIQTSSNGAAISMDITDTGNQAIDVQAGDLIVAFWARGGVGNTAGSMTSTGYTKVFYQYNNDTYDTNIDVFSKIADGTETSVVFAATGNTADSIVACVLVFRGVKEIKYVLARQRVNTDDVPIPNITNLNYGNICVVVGASAHAAGQAATKAFEQAGDLDEFWTRPSNDTTDVTLGMGYRRITTEIGFAPGRMDGDLSAASSGICAGILVLN
jgi:hypothetical protein